MMKDSKLLDDMARLASGAMGSAMEATREVERMVKNQLESLLSRMNLVNRDEFEAVKAMAAKAREEQEKQAELIDSLQKEIESLKVKNLI